jgi:hypothetical protein
METNNAIIRLNVGGQHFVTTRATLCAVEGSLLANIFRSDSTFAPPIETIGGEVFLDRNPIAFGYILDYLRDGCRMVVDLSNNYEGALLQRLRTDADYFGLDDLVHYCDAELENAKRVYKDSAMKLKKRMYEYDHRW